MDWWIDGLMDGTVAWVIDLCDLGLRAWKASAARWGQWPPTMEVGVQFVQEEHGLVEMHDAEQDGGFQVMGARDFGTQGA